MSGTPIERTFRSELAAPPERVWRWITSVDGISRELWPLMKMTAPANARNIQDMPIVTGRPLFRSWILLFGVLPIDRSELTLLELTDGKGFVEQSPMKSLRLWRHERWIEPAGAGTVITDKLTFIPRLAAPVTRWFVETLFRHRHAVLRERFAGGPAPVGR